MQVPSSVTPPSWPRASLAAELSTHERLLGDLRRSWRDVVQMVRMSCVVRVGVLTRRVAQVQRNVVVDLARAPLLSTQGMAPRASLGGACARALRRILNWCARTARRRRSRPGDAGADGAANASFQDFVASLAADQAAVPPRMMRVLRRALQDFHGQAVRDDVCCYVCETMMTVRWPQNAPAAAAGDESNSDDDAPMQTDDNVPAVCA
jgi:hypothetical protein